MGWAFPLQSLIKKKSHRLAYRPVLWRCFNCGSLFVDNSSVCQAEKITNQHWTDTPLVEDPISSTQVRGLTIICKSGSRDFNITLIWPPWTRHSCVQAYTQTPMYIYKIKNKNLNKYIWPNIAKMEVCTLVLILSSSWNPTVLVVMQESLDLGNGRSFS